jgi:hypothetical protein
VRAEPRRAQRSTAPDQALGLRQLFAPRAACVLPVVAAEGERPGAAALALARAVNAAGRRCLVIDATRGEIARSLGLAVRYDLRHAADGHRRLADVVLEASPGLAVLPAARGLADLARAPHPGARLAHLAQALGVESDWIVIASDAAGAEACAALAGSAEIAVACRAGPTGRTAAYSLMKRLARTGETAGFRLFLGAHACADQAGRELAQVAESFLGLPARYAAQVPGADPLRLAAELAHWQCAALAGAAPPAEFPPFR